MCTEIKPGCVWSTWSLWTTKYPNNRELSNSTVTGPAFRAIDESRAVNSMAISGLVWTSFQLIRAYTGEEHIVQPGFFLPHTCRLSPLTWLTIAPLCQCSQASISSLDSCSGLRSYRDNGNFYISTYMSNRHLKLKVARAELKAVKQSLGVIICFSPFLHPSCTHPRMANLWAIPDDSNFQCILAVSLSI